MKYFAATYTYGPTELVDETRPTHREWIQQQLAAGRIIAAGPYLDGGRQALVLLRMDDDATQADAEAFLDQDPYIAASALAERDVRLWNAVANTFGDTAAE